MFLVLKYQDSRLSLLLRSPTWVLPCRKHREGFLATGLMLSDSRHKRDHIKEINVKAILSFFKKMQLNVHVKKKENCHWKTTCTKTRPG